MEKEFALKIWEAVYGDRLWATDCFGTWMYKEDYGELNKKRNGRPGGTGKYFSYGWEIDHIRPKSSFDKESDADLMNNYEPMHWENNRKKADNYPSFVINKQKYKIVKCDICNEHNLDGYGILNASGLRIDWKGVTKRYYTNN